MKAVVMAGGEGSRLRPITIGRPKPMVPIVNKAVISHIFDLLKHHGITEVVVTLRYMASAIEDFYDDGSSITMKLITAVRKLLIRMNTPIAVMHKTLAKSSAPNDVDCVAGTNTTEMTLQHRVSRTMSMSNLDRQ